MIYKCILSFVGLMAELAISQAQNLVPNPSFEEYKELRCDLNVPILPPYENAKTWFQAILTDWTLPTNIPSQILSTTLDKDCLANPTNPNLFIRGYPKHGNNMIALYLLSNYGIRANGRSYVQVKLKEKLISGENYLAGGFYSFSDGIFGTNNLGMFFSTEAIGTDTTLMLKYDPQINEEKVNSDPNVWKQFGGCITSSGTEQYLTIGGFFEDKDTKVVQLVDGDIRGNDFAIYLVDSVFVEKVSKLIVPNVITPNGDMFNEKFIVEGLKKNQWAFQVYNRWGKSVYQVKNYENEWDGGGLSEGVYFYQLNHNVCKNLNYKGTLTIIH